MLINTVPCRVKKSKDTTLGDLLRSIQTDHADMLSYSSFRWKEIQNWLGMDGDQSMLQTNIVFENLPAEDQDSHPNIFSQVTMDNVHESSFNDYDMQLIVEPLPDKMIFTLQYKGVAICHTMASRLMDRYVKVLEWMLEKLGNRELDCLIDSEELSIDERKTVLALGTGPKAKVPFHVAHSLFEKNTVNYPEAIAVEQGDESITYGELNRRAEILACDLMKKGVQTGDYVGLVTLRSIEMIIGIFAILKSGAAYVPVDTTLPHERISYILETANCKHCLVQETVPQEVLNLITLATSVMIPSHKVEMESSEEYIAPSIPGSSASYVVFTSGSTGKPKGVAISHASLSNYLTTKGIFNVIPGGRVSQFASVGFDMCVAEIFGSLSRLGTTVLRGEDYMESVKLVNVLFSTPSALLKMDPLEFPNLKKITVGGERISNSIVQKWAPYVELINAYGPTEITIASSTICLKAGSTLSIGKPLQNTRQYIVDKNMQLVPQGVPGELLIGGPGMAIGYVGRPDLTAQKFIYDHFENDGSVMYRTGDICRWTENGEILILGRVDDMVKVKGYRIELDEVAKTIASHESVDACTVLVRKDLLVAYVTPHSVDVESLRDYAARSMPVYMMPSIYVKLSSFPMNVNGKVPLY
jgi:amino acid adenylation domain-containing protein